MSNHFHVILRPRSDAVAEWSDGEMAARWWRLFSKRRNEDGSAAGLTEFELRSLYGDKAEVIARLTNAQNECTGKKIKWILHTFSKSIVRFQLASK